MSSLKLNATAIAVTGALLIGLPLYGFISMRNHFDDRVSALERELKTVRAQYAQKVQEVASDLSDVAEKMDTTTRQLEGARKLAESLQQEHAHTTQRLRTQLDSASKAVSQLRFDATSRLEEVQQETASKIGAVSGEMQTVKVNLDSTRTDLVANRREIGEVRDNLGKQIARNSTELAELRRRGERDYVEFDVRKSKDMDRIADIRIQLKRADPKKQKYDVVLFVDDNKFEKKDRTANEPVTFLVGRDRIRYEFVVNYVEKDRIRGYISTPKDRILSAEVPALKQ